MNSQQLRTAARQHGLAFLGEQARFIIAISAAATILSSIIWFFIGDDVQPYVELPDQVDGIEDNVTILADRVETGFDEQAERIGRVEGRVNTALRPDAVEWDTLRTGIIGGVCERGQVCTVEMVVKRTPDGNTCDRTPTVARFVRDGDGVVYPAENPNPDHPTPSARFVRDWLTIEHLFVVPRIATPGDAVYLAELAYTGCDFAGPREVVRQSSPEIRFTIK